MLEYGYGIVLEKRMEGGGRDLRTIFDEGSTRQAHQDPPILPMKCSMRFLRRRSRFLLRPEPDATRQRDEGGRTEFDSADLYDADMLRHTSSGSSSFGIDLLPILLLSTLHHPHPYHFIPTNSLRYHHTPLTIPTNNLGC